MVELRDMLPKPLREGLSLVSDVCSLVVFAIVSWSSMSVIIDNPNNTTATLQIPFWVFFLPNLLGFALLTVGYLLILMKRIGRSENSLGN